MSREVEVELQRVVQRWRQLPLDRALSYSGRVRVLIQSLADAAAVAHGVPVSAVPDCEPATLMDQLTVTIYDLSASAAPAGSTLASQVAALRHDLP